MRRFIVALGFALFIVLVSLIIIGLDVGVNGYLVVIPLAIPVFVLMSWWAMKQGEKSE